MEILLKRAKIAKTAKIHMITIPKSFIDNGIINHGEEYEVKLRLLPKKE